MNRFFHFALSIRGNEALIILNRHILWIILMSGLHLTLVKVQLLITLLLIGLDLTLGLLRADWLPVLASKVADYC